MSGLFKFTVVLVGVYILMFSIYYSIGNGGGYCDDISGF